MILGLDVGGTNIDGVIIENNKIISKVKYEIYENQLLESIITSLDKLLIGCDKSKIKRINLSTTICTNAIVENTIDKVGMIIQSGPGIGTEHLSCGDINEFIKGSIDHRGRINEYIDIDEIKNIIKNFKENNIEAVGIVTKFSTRNPSHELTIKEMLEKEFDIISMGHSLSGKLNFPRRVYTTYLNSAVLSTFDKFAKSIIKTLKEKEIEAPIYILKADGGTMSLEKAMENPVETILSGPAASFMGAKALLDDKEDSIILDIGGTTTDISFLVDGSPLFEPLGISIDNYPTLVRSIYSVSIGVGGNSEIKVEDNNIKIGPKKAKKPYALGGDIPTPTDAMIYLEKVNVGDFEKAKEAINTLANKLGLTKKETANLILDTMADMIKNKTYRIVDKINQKPMYTVREVLENRKLVPTSIKVIGGPAKAMSDVIESKFNLTCNYPVEFKIANAIGAAVARPTQEVTIIADTQRKVLSVPELNIYTNIEKDYSLEKAKNYAYQLLDNKDIEITEQSSFNMVDGFYKVGENIRVKAQIRPGLLYSLRSDM